MLKASREKPVANEGQLFPFERNGLPPILLFQSVLVPLHGGGHAGHQLGQSLLVNAALAQDAESAANFSRRRTTHCENSFVYFPIGEKKKENRSNLVRDSITAAAENVAAGLWALMGRGGNRISATEDRCPGNPDRPTGICRYNRGLNRHRSLSAPTPFPNVSSSITYRFFCLYYKQ